jgi:hypothetical protein
MIKGRTILVLAAAVAALAAVVTSASATTSPTNYRIFHIQLTDSGVKWSPSAKIELGEVGLFKVTNVSKSPRAFSVSTRGTHVLKAHATEAFYEIFPTLGSTKWTSRVTAGKTARTTAGKTFTGVFKIVPCKNVNGTTSCNGTDN